MTALVHYDTARRALAECSRIDEVKEIHDRAAAIKAYARQANDQQLVADAERIIWRARNRLGELLAGSVRAGRPAEIVKNGDNYFPRLEDVGVSRNLSSQAQRLAAIPEDEKERAFAAREPEKELRGLLARKQRESRHSDIAAKAVAAKSLNGQRFALLYCDPPWRFDTYGYCPRVGDQHYPTLTYEQLHALHIDGRPIRHV